MGDAGNGPLRGLCFISDGTPERPEGVVIPTGAGHQPHLGVTIRSTGGPMLTRCDSPRSEHVDTTQREQMFPRRPPAPPPGTRPVTRPRSSPPRGCSPTSPPEGSTPGPHLPSTPQGGSFLATFTCTSGQPGALPGRLLDSRVSEPWKEVDPPALPRPSRPGVPGGKRHTQVTFRKRAPVVRPVRKALGSPTVPTRRAPGCRRRAAAGPPSAVLSSPDPVGRLQP
jgi:hypothetical protein